MMLNHRICAVLFAVFLAGCQSPHATTYSTGGSPAYSLRDPDIDPTVPSIKEDKFSPFIKVETEVGRKQNNKGSQMYSLNGAIDRKNGVTVTFVQWVEVYSAKEWRFYYRASDDSGTSLDFHKVARNVSSCTSGIGCVYDEVYNIYFTPAQIKAAKTNGLLFKIYGKRSDERVVNIPANVVAEFDAKMIEARQLNGAKH